MLKIRDLCDVSALLFFILGFYYIGLILMFRNDFYASQTLFLMRMSDIPFAFAALLYGGSHFFFQLKKYDEEISSPWEVVIIATGLLLFGVVVFVNFAFPGIA
ncbi:hypothetical protein HZA43_05975 [Candidatus Peregrinibacteria bacterium]|nr:hypothetical protein [Candidatus Peregrinibacteria bacterium]